MDTVTDYFGRERLVLECSHGVLMHVLQCIACLRIETRTGLKHSQGSVLALVREQYGVRSRTKAGALEEMIALRDHLRRGLDTVDPASGVAGVSLLVPLEGGWQAFGGVDVYPLDLEGQS